MAKLWRETGRVPGHHCLSFVATMHIDCATTHRNGKSYTRVLLRETYREAGKVKHRTIPNLSHCQPEEIEAIRLALKHKDELAEMVAAPLGTTVYDITPVSFKQGLSVGAVWLLFGFVASDRPRSGSGLSVEVFAGNTSDDTHISQSTPKLKRQLNLRIVRAGQRNYASRLVNIAVEERSIVISTNDEEIAEAARLNGYYAIRTDLTKETVSKEIVHNRYKDLAMVEIAFRDSKLSHHATPTLLLEIHRWYRPGGARQPGPRTGRPGTFRVKLLALAHDRTCEVELADQLAIDLDQGRVPDIAALSALFGPNEDAMPEVAVIVLTHSPPTKT